jgi:hypothetical protein
MNGTEHEAWLKAFGSETTETTHGKAAKADDAANPAVNIDFEMNLPDTSTLETVIQTGKPLLIIAEDAEGEALARALPANPRLVLLDEPTNGTSDTEDVTTSANVASTRIPAHTPEFVSITPGDPGRDGSSVDWLGALLAPDEDTSLPFELSGM